MRSRFGWEEGDLVQVSIHDRQAQRLCVLTAACFEEWFERLSAATPTEPKHLKRACIDAATALVAREDPSATITNDSLAHGARWVGTGRIDVAIERSDGVTIGIELKCGTDLSSCAWDVLKLASCVDVATINSGYLLAAAPEAVWSTERSVGAEFFRGRCVWDSFALRDRFISYFRRWEREGHYPLSVPVAVETFELQRSTVPITETAWELWLARVEPVGRVTAEWPSTLHSLDGER